MAKKVTFTLTAEIAGDSNGGVVLGEFNNWNYEEGIILKKQKDGSFTASALLEAGKSYQYRYLLEDGRWVNDGNATGYLADHLHQVENCVIVVPEEKEKKPAVKKETIKKETAKKETAKKETVKKEAAKKAEAPKKEKTKKTKEDTASSKKKTAKK